MALPPLPVGREMNSEIVAAAFAGGVIGAITLDVVSGLVNIVRRYIVDPCFSHRAGKGTDSSPRAVAGDEPGL